jgi:hypothetical protein
MPAQWPLFINNVSSKMASRTLKTSDDMAMLISQEYFNAVKTSQTPFGNIHQSGQKAILDAGFKEAFKQLYESQTPSLEDKKLDPLFADLKDALPIPNINANIDKELQACLATKPEYMFYDFGFKSSPVVTKELITEIKYTEIEVPQVTFTGIGGKAPYSFKYSIDGVIQNGITSDKSGEITIDVDKSKSGSFEYRLINIVDADKISTDVDSYAVVIIPENKYEETYIKETSIDLPKLKDDEIIQLLADRVYTQYDDTEEFRLWLKRLKYGVNSSLGDKVAKVVLSWIDNNEKYNKSLEEAKTKSKAPKTKTPPKEPLVFKKKVLTYNKHKFQSSYSDDKSLPLFVDELNIIAKFTYYPPKDRIAKKQHDTLLIIGALGFNPVVRHENDSVTLKLSLWKIERDRWNNDRIDCINKIADSYKKEADKGSDEAYDKIAKAVIDYWMSTLTKPFQPGPPIPPCMIPTPGTYIPVYYGSQKKLAANIKRALNSGKYFEYPPTIQPATKVVATALAVAFSLHLLELKFIYVGQIYVGVSTAPMIGFVPLVF